MSSSSSSVPISGAGGPGSIAPTPQNTPLDKAPLSTAMSKPTLPPTIGEEGSDDEEAADAPPDTPPAGGLAGLGPKGHNAIMGLVQQRLQGLMGQSSGYIESLPSGTKKRVLALKGVQTKYEKLLLDYKKETIELERKVSHVSDAICHCLCTTPPGLLIEAYLHQYAVLSTPLFDRRLEIINGSSLPTTEELEKGHEQEVKDHEEFSDDDEDPAEDDSSRPTFLPQEPILDDEPGAKEGVAQFWLTALQNHSGISELITDRDEKALEFLKDIRYDYLPADGQSGFKVTFEFGSNPFFENSTLSKTYYYQVSSCRCTLGHNADSPHRMSSVTMGTSYTTVQKALP
jgi:nucleosome assembly protein 1-like 1